MHFLSRKRSLKESQKIFNLLSTTSEETSEDFIKSIFDSRLINLKIRHAEYKMRWKSLERLPNTRLGKIRYAKDMNELLSLCDGVDLERNEIYFNRSSILFDRIIEFYNTDKMHLNLKHCIVSYYDDMKYWGFDKQNFQSCCFFKYHCIKDDAINFDLNTKKYSKQNANVVEEEFYGCCKELREKIWTLTEKPKSSNYAKVRIL